MTLQEFAQNTVRHKRRAMDLTQEQLAEKAKVGLVYYNRFERGRMSDIKLSVLHRICQALDMPLTLYVTTNDKKQYVLSSLPDSRDENRQ